MHDSFNADELNLSR